MFTPAGPTRRLPAILALSAGLASTALADPLEVRGTIDQVTVYRGQAMVTRSIPLAAKPGILELVVTDLPDQVVEGSLFAESAGGVEVRSVRFRTRPVIADVNDEVRKLDDQLRALDDQQKAAARHAEVLAQHKAYLDKLEAFVAPTATAEMTRGVLNADTLAKLTDMLLTQRQTLADNELKLGLEQRGIAESMELLRRERAKITSGSSRTVREALVLAEVKDGDKPPALRVRYLVNSASWSPSYTVRADGDKKNVVVEYYAAVEQMTGEDWSGIHMTLSTATPSLAARAPRLEPLVLSLASPSGDQMAQQLGGKAYADAKRDIARQKQEIDTLRSRSGPTDGASKPAEFDKSINFIASNETLLDLQARERIFRLPGAQTATLPHAAEEGISVVYDLAGLTSLPSRSDRQQVQIAAIPMPAEFYKIASPALTTNVYDEALATNSSSLVLLSGPVAAYSAGRFVGSADLPTVAIGESFTLGFGIDAALKAGRELVERAETIQGGNRVVDLTYRLTLENFGSTAAPRLMDRIPKVKDSEIKLTLTSHSTPLSEDDAAIQAQKKTGLARWDVTVPPQAFGNKALAVEYTIRLEHDKQMTVAGIGAKP
jgi:hypothetical protein